MTHPRPALTALLLAACSSGTTGGDEVRTLDNCGTNVAADVPAFYKKYFRCADISLSGGSVVIKSIGLPPHKSPYYAEGPNSVAFDTRNGERQQNPNMIEEQSFTMTIPSAPVAKGLTINAALVDRQAGTSNEEYRGAPLGVSLDGVAMFHGVAAPGDDIATEEQTFDAHEGHPQNTGMYHYHAGSPGPLEVMQAAGEAEVELYAVMCDGTLVLGCTELDGSSPDGADFDSQNGHVKDIADKSGTTHFAQRYHTHVCRSRFTQHKYAPEIQYHSSCGN